MASRDLTLILRSRDEASQTLKRVAKSSDDLGKSFGQLLKQGIGLGAGIAGFNVLASGAYQLGNRLRDAAAAGINFNATLERASLQFKVLLGSTDAAGARIKDLYDFAATTPFEFGEVLAASRTLQTLTDGALAAGDELRFVGDVAAALDIPFQEAAFWIGRLYSGLRAGQPVGEAMLRLQELGVVSGDLRRRMEALNEETGTGRAAWEAFRTEVGEKTNGATKELSQSFSGLMSTLIDTANQALGQALRPQFDQAKVAMAGFIDVAGSPEGKARIEQMAGAMSTLAQGVVNVGQAAATAAPVVGGFFDFIGQKIQGFGFNLFSPQVLAPGREADIERSAATVDKSMRVVEEQLDRYQQTLQNVRRAHLDGTLAAKDNTNATNANANAAKQGTQQWLSFAGAEKGAKGAANEAAKAIRDETSALRDMLSVANQRLGAFRGALLPGERELTEQIARVEQDIRVRRFDAMFQGGGEAQFGKVAELERWVEALRLQKEIQFDFQHQMVEFRTDTREVHTFDEIVLGIQSTQAEIAVFEQTIDRLERAAKLAADGVAISTVEILEEMQMALESIPRGEAELWADATRQAQNYFNTLNEMGIWRRADNPFMEPAAAGNTTNNQTTIIVEGGGGAQETAAEIERRLAARASVQIAMG